MWISYLSKNVTKLSQLSWEKNSLEASVLLSVFQTTCRRFCNQQKTAALNVVIMNTFSQNLPDFLQNHLKLYPIFFKLHIWCHFSDIWYFIIKSRKNSDLFRIFFKHDEIPSDSNQIKIRTQSNRITFKKFQSHLDFRCFLTYYWRCQILG